MRLVKHFTDPAAIPLFVAHAALIIVLSLSMVMSMPTF